MEDKLLFEYPSESQADDAVRNFIKSKGIKKRMEKAFWISTLVGFIYFILSGLTQYELLNNILFFCFILMMIIAYISLKSDKNKHFSSSVFISVYSNHMEIVQYDNNSNFRIEALIYYDDIYMAFYGNKKESELCISFYETENSEKICYDSNGNQLKDEDTGFIVLHLQPILVQRFFQNQCDNLFKINTYKSIKKRKMKGR